MLRIAVCDDDVLAVERHRMVAEDCLRQCGVLGEVVVYERSENLLYDITVDGFFFDLILLDIEMPKYSGMVLAERIKPFLANVRIIFVTSHLEYAVDAFELAIFRYVPKDDLANRLPAAIRDAVRLLALEEGRCFVIQTNNRLEKIPYKSIYYIERAGKNACIVSAGGVSRVRKSLQQVYEELAAEEFVFIDRGCIVNIIHVMQIKDGQAILQNGVSLAISRSHLQPVKAFLNTYWGAHI